MTLLACMHQILFRFERLWGLPAYGVPGVPQLANARSFRLADVGHSTAHMDVRKNCRVLLQNPLSTLSMDA